MHVHAVRVHSLHGTTVHHNNTSVIYMMREVQCTSASSSCHDGLAMLRQEIVTLSEEDTIETSTYADLHKRSQLCALALEQLGVGCAPFRMSAFHVHSISV